MMYNNSVIVIIQLGAKKMFDPKKPEYINKTFRLSVDLVKKLENVAQSKQMSLNAIVAQCCEYALDNMDTGSKNK